MLKPSRFRHAAAALALTFGGSFLITSATAQSNWTGASDNDWTVSGNWSAGIPVAGTDVVFGTPIPGTGAIIELGSGSLANSLWIQDNYTFDTNDLTLTSGNIRVNLGQEFTLNSQLSGSNGLTLLGGGVLRLTNALNDYTGTTSIAGGMVVITDEDQLGASGTAINVTAGNSVPSNTSTIGITGGGLMLDGTGGSINFTRDLNLEGRGHFGDRSGALVSQGNNTLSGVVTTSISTQTPVTNRPTRLLSSNGTLTLSGTFNPDSLVSGTQVTTLGGVNTAGAGGNFAITGVLTGLGVIEKSGAGTLFWNPSDTSGFNGRLRVSGAATAGQSSVRVSSGLDGLNTNPIFGAANAADASAPIDLNGGVLEIRNDNSINFARNVYLRASSTAFVGPAEGGSGINNTITFGTFRLTANQTPTFNSRNGYGVTFTGAWSQESSNNPNTVTNNMGGTLTFNSSAWSNSDSNNRTLTIGGNGNTVITGTVNTSGVGIKSITKTGTGMLTLNGTGGTINGDVNVNGGTVAIRDFRSINNNTAAINIGTGSTAGAFMVGSGAAVGSAANLTSTKAINLAGSTAGATIFANQTGTNPVLLNGAFTVATGIKTLTLGGSNTASNAINAAISNGGVIGTTTLTATAAAAATTMTLNTVTGLNVGDAISGPAGIPGGTTITAINPLTKVVTLSAALTAAVNSGVSVSSTNLQAPTSITKVGGGTWVLGATNTYTGNTNITNGRLALQANAASSNIIDDTNTILFGNSNSFAGGTLEYRGQASTNNTETIGRLQTPDGSNTLLLTPGSGGTASVTISQLDAIGAAGLNVVGADHTNNTVTITGANGLVDRALYFSGADFAYRDTNKLRAPVYGTDATFFTTSTAMTASANQEVTGAGFNQGALTINTLKLSGSPNINLTGNLTISTRGILATGGNSTLSGTGSIPLTTTTSVIRVNGASDSLTISAPITGTTAGIAKNGAGTLIMSGANSTTGTFTINQGTVRLGAATGLGGARALTMRQNTTLDLNGFTPANSVNAFNNNGTITSTGAATLTVGGANGTGTSFGIVTGAVSLTKAGTGNQSWLGSSTYTGITTIGSTGIVSVDTLADGGVASGIGASTSAASNLVFTGTTGGLNYTGNIRDNSLILGSRSASTDRLFTLSGGGVTLQSDATNNNAIVWSNTGAIVHGTTAARTVIFTGGSLGDNTFNPQLTDSGAGSDITSVTKNGAGQWNLGNSANTYTGATTVTNGILALNNNGALPSGSPLVLNSGSATSVATFQMSGNFVRNLTATPIAGTGDVNFAGTIAHTTGGVGFAAHTTPLTVAIGGLVSPTALTWGSGGFVGTAFTQNLAFGSGSALSYVDFRNAIDLNGAATRTINVLDNGNTGADYALISGDISGTGSTLRKIGGGALVLSGDNSYTGQTLVEAGTLQVYSLGDSSPGGPATSSVGASNVTMDNTNAIVLGNGTTGGAILQYTGPGETSDRKIRLNTTTGGNQIHADGTGSLILTNVANDFATPTGNKTLSLRGTSVYTNFITSQLTNDAGGGTLGIGVDGSTAWVLTNGTNSYTGTTTAGAGLLGIGDNGALGGSTLVNTNGNVFAYGADRTLSNAVTLSNNATNGWQGDYNLTFTGAVNFAAAANNITTNNSISAGKALTFNGMTANAITANRSWTLNGPGHTIVNGDFTTTTNFGVPTTINNGMLSLGGTGVSTFNRNASNVDVDNGTLRFTANNALPATYFNGSTTASSAITTTTFTVANTAGLVVGNNISGTNIPAGTVIVSIDSPTQFTASAAPTGAGVASGATITYVGSGGVVFSPETLTGDIARLELNGTNQTISNFTTTGNGTVVIDNNSAGSANLRIGASGGNVDFGTGGGTYSILNTGAGALSLIHAGSGTGVITSGVTLNYEGQTASEGGGTFNISSAVNATSGLSVTNGSTLGLLGGITNQNLITSILVDAGSTLSLLDGAGTVFSNVGNLSLGANGSGTTTLNLNIGTSATDTLSLLIGGTLALGNTITFNMTDAGMTSGSTYTLLSIPDGGINAFGFGNMIQGATPGGFDSYTWNVTDTEVSLTLGNLITGDLFWRGSTDTTWNGALNNWSTDKAGTSAALSLPGAGTDVVFQWDAPTNAAVTTTLEQNFKINSLTFEASTTPANTPSSITINPGALTTARVEVAPQVDTDGIAISAGGPAAVTIAAAVQLGADQTWTVADSGSVLSIGQLRGEADVTVAGPGRVVLTNAAASTFNSGATSNVTITGGVLETQSATALGSTSDANLAQVNLNGGAFFYNNATTGTVSNPISLNGGTLSAGGNGQNYNGNITVDGNSFVNLRNNNSATLTDAARTVNLLGVVSGSNSITLDSINTATAGNQLTGNFLFYNGNSTWNGALNLTRGSAFMSSFNNVNTGLEPFFGYNGIINFNQFGRVIQRGINDGAVTRSAAINFAAGAVGEYQVDNISATLLGALTVTQNGAVNMNAGSIARFSLEDASSSMILNGGIVLNGNASLSFNGTAATSTLAINTVGISGTGDLALNDEAGTWAVSSDTIAINAASTFTGNVSFTEGTLVLGHKDALGPAGTNTLTMLGGTLQANTDLSGANTVANSVNLAANTTFAGTNNLSISGVITNSVDGNRTLTNNITSPAGLVFSGSTFNLTTAASTTGRVFTITGTGDTTINNVIQNNGTGASSIVKSGAGLLTLGGTNTYTGGTTINFGTVRASANNVLPNTGTITVNATSAGAATLDLNGFSDTIAALTLGGTGGLATSVNSVTTGAGTLTLGGNVTVTATGNWTTPALISGILNLGGAARTFSVGNSTGTDVDLDLQAAVLGGAFALTKSGAGVMLFNAPGSTYTGGTVISAGELRLGQDNVIPNTGTVTLNGGGSSILNLNGFSDTIAALTLGGTGGGAGSIYQVNTGAGTLTVGGNVSTSATGAPYGTVPLITGNLSLGASTRNFNIADSTAGVADLQVDALISGGAGAGITKIGVGGLLLNNAGNSYSGPTTVNAGLLTQGVAGAIPSGTNVTVSATAASAVLALNDISTSIGTLSFGGGTTTSVSQVVNGTGTLTLGGNVTYSATNNPATAEILGGTLNLGGVDRTFTVGDSTTQVVDLRVTSAITNGSVTKAGLGTLEFTGTNTYSGTTTINAGTLLINGDNSGATGSIIIADGAVLGGSGTVGGATTIVGIHSPGNSPGIQTFNAGLDYNGANTSFVWELYSSTATPTDRGNATIGWDGVNVTGGDLNFISPTTMSLVFNGTTGSGSTVNWADALWTSNQQWLVYQVTGGGNTLNFSNFSIFTTDWKDSAGNDFSAYGGSASNFFLSQVGNDIYLNFNAIPEPSRALLVLIGALGMTLRRRRKTV